jgi:hypothetical protein
MQYENSLLITQCCKQCPITTILFYF